MNIQTNQMQNAYFLAAAAYGIWGILPIYWKMMTPASSTEVLAHRMIWSLVICALLIPLMGQGRQLTTVIQDRSALLRLALSGSLVGFNWLTYIWAVQNNFIIETSLGYFLCPLFTVGIGIMILGERLGWRGWTAIFLASCGVILPLLKLGYFPWIAFTLAGTFSVYSFVRKTVRAQSLVGLSVETSFMFLPALSYLMWLAINEDLVFMNFSWQVDLLLIGAGLMTSLPLLLFARAAKTLPLSTIGLMQYIAPLLQLACGVLIYSEPFTQSHSWTFGWIWFALMFYSWEVTRNRIQRIKS